MENLELEQCNIFVMPWLDIQAPVMPTSKRWIKDFILDIMVLIEGGWWSGLLDHLGWFKVIMLNHWLIQLTSLRHILIWEGKDGNLLPKRHLWVVFVAWRTVKSAYHLMEQRICTFEPVRSSNGLRDRKERRAQQFRVGQKFQGLHLEKDQEEKCYLLISGLWWMYEKS